MRQALYVLSLLIIVLLTTSCSNSAGATSETTNGVAVLNSDGTPAASISVFVRKSNKLLDDNETPDSLYTRTNNKGFFELDSSLTVDHYIIELTDSNGYGLQIIPDTIQNSLVLPDTLTLQKQGKLFGTVSELATMTNDFRESTTTEINVQIYGLDRITTVDSTGNFRFDDLPAGDIRLHIVANKSDTVKDTIAESDKYEIIPDDSINTGNYIIGSTLEDEISLLKEFLKINGLSESLLSSRIKIRDGHVTDIEFDSIGLDTLIPEIGSLRLKTFSCAKNNIKSVPKEFGNLIDLYYIDLSYNEIQYLPEEMANLVNCSEMDIEHNNLRDIPKTFTYPSKFPHLREIHVKNNCLTDLSREVENWIDKYSWAKSWRDSQQEWDEEKND